MSQPAQIDRRGHRFSGVLTTVVLAATIVTIEPLRPVALALVVFQLAVFAVGRFYRLTASPYARLYARAIRPRIGPPQELEDSAPAAFSQLVGVVFLATALVALVAGATAVAYIALSLALLAALLNASVGLCVGCELYLVLQRLQTSKA
jgi:small-conductance mechanosensitive channel